MSGMRLAGWAWLGRGVPVVVLGLVAGLVAGAGPARAGGAGGRYPGTVAAAAGVISTVAGGVGGPTEGTSVSLGLDGGPCAVSSGGGAVYVGGVLTVRRLDPSTGRLSTSAGTGTFGPLGDGLPAADASFVTCGEAVDQSGNLLIADDDYNGVRVVAATTGTFYGQPMTAGDIYAVAGNGTAGFSGDGGPATSATLNNPAGVAVDRAGNLVITDAGNQRIRVVAESTSRFYGRRMTAGDIYTVAGGGSSGLGDGGPATSAELAYPAGVAVDRAGNLLIADSGDQRVRVVAVKTGTFYGQPMTAGDIYTVAGGGRSGLGDGGPATSAELDLPAGVAVDGAGNLLIADTYNNRVRAVAATTGTFYGQPMTAGDIYTVAGNGTAGFSGDGGPAASAELNGPSALAVDRAGNLLIADSFNYRVRVLAATTGSFYGQPMTAGDIYTVAGNGYPWFSGDGGLATSAQLNLSSPVGSAVSASGVAVDAAGNLVIADTFNNRVRVVAAKTGTFYGIAMTARHIYTVAGGGSSGVGDGGPATSAELGYPGGVAVDAAGNLVIADTADNRIRLVAATTGTFYGVAMTAGDIYTVAGNGTAGFSGRGGPATSAELDDPYAVTVDHAGNLVITDTGNHQIRVVAGRTGRFYQRPMTAGRIYTITGLAPAGFSGDGRPALHAALDHPEGAAVDRAGNLLIADTYNNRIRVVAERTGTFYGQAMTAGDIYTVAGGGSSGLGDGGPATSAELNGPSAVTVDRAGNLLIADSEDNRVRMVAATTGTFYGQPMTAGDIYTVAGNGGSGFSGDGGPAASAELGHPAGVAVDTAGNLLIADLFSERIRKVTS